MKRLVLAALVGAFAAGLLTRSALSHQPEGDRPVRLGNFSVGLAVKDIAASRAFYEKLGFVGSHIGYKLTL